MECSFKSISQTHLSAKSLTQNQIIYRWLIQGFCSIHSHIIYIIAGLYDLYFIQNISENNIGTEGIASICEALQENRALKYLNVSGALYSQLMSPTFIPW